MVTKVSEEDIARIWADFKIDQTNQSLRNKLIERFLPLVRYNAERVWAKLPDGVDLNDLISAGVFGLIDAIEVLVHPIVLGKGGRLFADGYHSPMKLADSKILSNGVVYLSYQIEHQA